MQSTLQDSADSISAKDSNIVSNDTSGQLPNPRTSKKTNEVTGNSVVKRPELSSNFIGFKCIKDSVWINIKRNGRKELNKKLKKDGTWVISKSDSVVVTVGVVGSIEFTLNGKSL